jgi:hypothetical protein
MFWYNWPSSGIKWTAILADQHTTELSPQQEYSRQAQLANKTKPKATTCNPHNQNNQR